MRKLFFVLAMCLVPVIALAYPPTGERLEAAIEGALDREPIRKALTTLSTTVLDAVDTDNSNKTDSAVQLFVVTNLDDTTDVCFGTIPVASNETCNETLCQTAGKWTAAATAVPAGNGAAAIMNCTHGDASMGSVVPKGQSRAFRYSGRRCGCMVASGAATDVQVERETR